MATVTVKELECGVTYTIVAGGTLNGELVGPRSSNGDVVIHACPVVEQKSGGKIYLVKLFKIVYVHKI